MQVADVRDFGAKGDGITDDAPAFQAAVDSLAGTRGVSRLPSGMTYAIGASITNGSGAAICVS